MKKKKEKPKGMAGKIKISVRKNIYIHILSFSSSNKESHDTRSNQKYLDRTTVDIWERNKELIRKRTDIGEHFTREVIQSYRIYIFTTRRKSASD